MVDLTPTERFHRIRHRIHAAETRKFHATSAWLRDRSKAEEKAAAEFWFDAWELLIAKMNEPRADRLPECPGCGEDVECDVCVCGCPQCRCQCDTTEVI